MTDKYKLKLAAIQNILDEAICNDSNEIYHIYKPEVEIVNIYDIDIPNWLLYCIDACCGKYKHFATQMFVEVITSISCRKFNEMPVPKDYVIIPQDWIDCYEDGYPICVDGDENGCMAEYLDSYIDHIYALTDALKNMKHVKN